MLFLPSGEPLRKLLEFAYGCNRDNFRLLRMSSLSRYDIKYTLFVCFVEFSSAIHGSMTHHDINHVPHPKQEHLNPSLKEFCANRLYDSACVMFISCTTELHDFIQNTKALFKAVSNIFIQGAKASKLYIELLTN